MGHPSKLRLFLALSLACTTTIAAQGVLVDTFFVEGGGFGGAWTAYPPLSSEAEFNLTSLGSTLWLTAVALEFVAFLLGGINFITTLMNSRAPGMKMHDIPMVLWMIVIAIPRLKTGAK